jgi:peptide/nickel transport system permease protein
MESVYVTQSKRVAPVARPAAIPRRREVDDVVLEENPPTQFEVFWRAFREHRMAFMGLCVVTTLAALCVVLPFVLPWSPTDIDNSVLKATPPSSAHPLGTDQIGRDVLSRLVSAGRISLGIGFIVAIVSAFIGTVVGGAAGYYGGRIDGVLMWIVNVLLTIPHIPLLISIAVLVASPDSRIGGFIGELPEWARIALVLALLGWLGISRVIRSQVMSVKEYEYVEAARALGAGDKRIMFVHVLPNSVSVLAVFTTLAVSGAILAESGLSVLGVGVNPPTGYWLILV